MRFLGIDYGTKKVGLAISDESGRLAFPYAVLANDQHLISKLKDLCQKETISKIVIGESVSFKREPNPLMEKIIPFREALETATGLPIDLEEETLTSAEAARLVGRDKNLDARAAAIILGSYLNRPHD